jgi:hypothetical protein
MQAEIFIASARLVPRSSMPVASRRPPFHQDTRTLPAENTQKPAANRSVGFGNGMSGQQLIASRRGFGDSAPVDSEPNLIRRKERRCDR